MHSTASIRSFCRGEDPHTRPRSSLGIGAESLKQRPGSDPGMAGQTWGEGSDKCSIRGGFWSLEERTDHLGSDGRRRGAFQGKSTKEVRTEHHYRAVITKVWEEVCGQHGGCLRSEGSICGWKGRLGKIVRGILWARILEWVAISFSNSVQLGKYKNQK